MPQPATVLPASLCSAFVQSLSYRSWKSNDSWVIRWRELGSEVTLNYAAVSATTASR